MNFQRQSQSSSLHRREMIGALAVALGSGPGILHELMAGEPSPPRSTRMARVTNVGGVPTLVVDDVPIHTATFETYAPRPRYFQQFAEAGTRVFGFSTNAAACDYGHSSDTWIDESTWDYSQFEQRAAMVLAADPRALLLPRVNLGTPRWWLDRHPAELERFADGSTVPTGQNPTLPSDRGFPSFASAKWRQAIGVALTRLIEHVKQTRFGPRVIGWCLAGGHTEEWYHWGCNTPLRPGYSEATQQAFCAWLRKKYRHDRALQDAWSDPEATLDSAQVPTAAERLKPHASGFRDPATQMQVIDFYQFWSELIPETIDYFARVARQATEGRHVIGAFYGYMYEFAGDPEFGHNAVSRLIRSPNIDFMAVTASYFHRQAALGCDYQRSPAASLALHGKLWYHDNDVVSYRAKRLMTERGFRDDADWTRNQSLQLKLLGYTPTPNATHAMYRRGWGFAMCRGMHHAWFDLHDGYFDAPDLMKEVERLNVLSTDPRLANRTSISEILIVADEASCAYANPRSDLLKRVLREPQNQLTRIGAPCDHVLLSDLPLVDFQRYRLILFMNCYHVDQQQRDAISRWKQSGKHLAWFGTPGWFLGHTRSLDQMESLTGFRFHIPPDETTPVRLPDSESTTQEWSIGPGAAPVATRAFGDWTSHYAAEPAIGSAGFRRLAEEAGVHCFAAAGDVLYASESLLVLHAADSGRREIRLPVTANVVDLVKGTEWTSVARLAIQLEMAETCLLHWLPCPQRTANPTVHGDT